MNTKQNIKLGKLDWMYIGVLVALTIAFAYVDGQSVL